jgi:hypothetical protein
MHEHPRLSVEGVHLVTLVVVRRCVIDREECPQWQEINSRLIERVSAYKSATVQLVGEQNSAVVTPQVERAVVLGQAFIEPERQLRAH